MTHVSATHAPDIHELLARLEDLGDAQSLLQSDYAAAHQRILAPVQAELAALDDEMQPMLTEVDAAYTALVVQIKALVTTHKATVRGTRVQAVYAAGRASWNTKHLLRIAKRLPEVQDCYTQGEPSVSIRRIG